MGSNPLKYRNRNDPIEKVMTAPQNPFIRPPRPRRATPDMTIKATPRMESKFKREPKLEPSKPPATTAYSNMASLLYLAMQGIVNCLKIKRPNEFIHSVKKANPHSFTSEKWGPKSPYHTAPSLRAGIAELISQGNDKMGEYATSGVSPRLTPFDGAFLGM
jgi:hypothetical protein